MADPNGMLERQGPNTRYADMIGFTDNDQVAARARIILAYLAEAAGYARAGIRPPRTPRGMELPEELIDALDADPELSEAFAARTPGRQKSYVIALASARAQATRVARITKFRGKITAGKGATER